MRHVYYNDNDPKICAWLRELVRRGLIAAGDVDERSIADVRADDVRGYMQCHFFAGIGGWSYALRLARWPDDRPVWTGSCPCQPFSAAGKQRGGEDERHLWPAFFGLIRECRPPTVIGEQVAGAAGLAWLDHVAADLEDAGYAAAAANLGAHSVGAPHIRQRLYWVAAADPTGRSFGAKRDGAAFGGISGQAQRWRDADGCGELGDADDSRLEGRRIDNEEHAGECAAWPTNPWRDLEWLACADGKARPTQPGLFPLAHGISARVLRLRGYGNAIVPQIAAEFISAIDDSFRVR